MGLLVSNGGATGTFASFGDGTLRAATFPDFAAAFCALASSFARAASSFTACRSSRFLARAAFQFDHRSRQACTKANRTENHSFAVLKLKVVAR